jgi:epoxyqueuosine reductase
MSKLVDDFYALLEKNQYQAKIVSAKNLFQIINKIQDFYIKGFIEENFFKERLSWIKKNLLENQQDAKSVIVVAVPRPQTKATFTFNGIQKALIIPPTYSGYEQTREKVENLITSTLQKQNYSTKRAIFPLKMLAVRSGLAEYGKNNICYVSGIGSFLQLVAVYTSIPHTNPLQEPKIMKLCKTCKLCQKACPTEAISKKRFLLHAEKCLTYHNEKNGNIPFPDWIEKKWHNSIVGCMHCQNVCPANKKFDHFIGIEEYFSEKETVTLLSKPTITDISPNTLEKLKRLNLADYLGSLSRNLKVFFY